MSNQNNKKVCVIGLGYIGLPTAALLANNNYEVLGVDTNKVAVDAINKGEIHIIEPNLDIYVKEAVSKGLLKAYSSTQPADIYIICVPTPFHSNDGIPNPNIDYIKEATLSIAPIVKSGDMIILESTSPVGTTNYIQSILREDNGVDNIYIGYCPERVLPGKILKELINNDRVIGGVDKSSTKAISNFYKSFVEGEILETNAKTAEMCKLTENSFRDVNIALANELSMICESDDINVWELIELANHHPRVNILQPGTGVGGHCIAVDPWFLVSAHPSKTRLIKSARLVNDSKPNWVSEQIFNLSKSSTIDNPKIACLGLSYKPDTDDLRESPAIEVVKDLINKNLDVVTVEPNIRGDSKFSLVSLEEALIDANIIAVLVGHKEFVNNDKLNKDNRVVDFCGVLKR